MQKQIQVLLTEQAKEFMQQLERHERRKIGETIRRVQDGQQGDWFKKLTGSDDI